MIDIKNIKLVAWDLDDTFWFGTISEGEITPIAEHIQLVHDLTDCGIINTICSKNDQDVAERKLRELGVWDEFVFASINWDNKAMRLHALIDGMALRPANVLFLDDNHFNLQEAQHVMPALMVAEPQDAIPELIAQVAAAEKKDLKHKRLAQYKVLEEKALASLSYGSSEDFLYATDIRVEMVEIGETRNEKRETVDEELLKRLHELVMRTNQLNFTKNRCSMEDLRQRIEDEGYRCGYVKVHDKFGDYGIVGLYVLHTETNTLEHFLFSCRTMGQKIEQWVYARLGFPKLTVVGDVRTQLNASECPEWINQIKVNGDRLEVIGDGRMVNGEREKKLSILLKAPCDLSNAQMFIQDAKTFDAEFTYVTDDGRSIEAYNHSVHIAGQREYTEDEKQQICEDCIFVDPAMLEPGLLFQKKYDVVFLSTLFETDYAIYRKKGTDIRVAWGGIQYPITDPLNWDKLIHAEIYTGGNHFTREWLEKFSAEYEFEGETSPKDYEVFLRKLLEWLPRETRICLILGATKIYEKEQEKAVHHKEINDVVMRMAEEGKRIRYVAIDDCVHSMSDFTDGINHYQTKVYYELAQKMIAVMNEVGGVEMRSASKMKIYTTSLLKRIRNGVKCILNTNSRLYRTLKRVYLFLTGRRDN